MGKRNHWLFLSALLICLVVLAGCQPSQPTPASAPSEGETAAAVLQAYRDFGGDIAALDAANPSITVEVTNLTGTVAAYDLTGGNPPCAGFVRSAPSLVFTLAEAAPAVKITFTGNQMANLVVVQEGEEIVCPEDAAATMTPELTLQSPSAGRYGVWVGRIDMDQPVNGRLTAALAP
jgi:hypothetical protein